MFSISSRSPTVSRVLGVALGTLLLACGGWGGGASPQAKALCDYLETDRECACDSYGAAGAPTIGGLTVQVLSVRKIDTSSAKVKSWDEQAALKKVGHSALAVEVAYTNTTPVKQGVTVVNRVQFTNGERARVQPYSSRHAMQGREGYLDLWKKPSIGPGQTKKTILVFAGEAEALDNALLHVAVVETRPNPRDPWGRRKLFTDEQVVLDLGPAS